MVVGNLGIRTSRRNVLGMAAGLAGSGIGISSARAQDSTPAASPAVDGPWTFTDDKGVVVELESRPERIVADVNAAAPLWDFGIRPVAVFGWNANEEGDFGPAGGNVDPELVEVVGNPTETIQLESTVSMQPDLIVTITWTPADPLEYWSIGPELVPLIQDIAPLVAISATGRADVNTERFAELAGLLGADLDSAELVAAREAYEQALTDFSSVAGSRSDLSCIFLYAGQEQTFYIANPIDWADLTLYSDLGLNILAAETPKDSFWLEVSLEEVGNYPADILYYSSRPGTLTVEELTAHPTFGQHPAIKAGQIGAWNQDFIMSFQGMATALATTIAPLSAAAKIT